MTGVCVLNSTLTRHDIHGGHHQNKGQGQEEEWWNLPHFVSDCKERDKLAIWELIVKCSFECRQGWLSFFR